MRYVTSSFWLVISKGNYPFYAWAYIFPSKYDFCKMKVKTKLVQFAKGPELGFCKKLK